MKAVGHEGHKDVRLDPMLELNDLLVKSCLEVLHLRFHLREGGFNILNELA